MKEILSFELNAYILTKSTVKVNHSRVTSKAFCRELSVSNKMHSSEVGYTTELSKAMQPLLLLHPTTAFI